MIPSCSRLCLLWIGILAVTLSLSPVQGQAQDSSASSSITGVLRDSQDHPVPSAQVCLQAADGNEPLITVQTDTHGAYRFPLVRAGTYSVKAADSEQRTTTAGPLLLHAKESKVVDLKFASAKGAQGAASGTAPDFFDEPHFTVAGVTDTTSLGGHASDTVVRNRESIAKATASLREDAVHSASVPTGNAMEGNGDYESARTQIRSLLGQQDKPALHHMLADLDEKTGRPLEAAQEYGRAAKLSPSEPYLFDWGAELLVHHAPEPASEVFSKGARLFPSSVRMHIGLGAASFARGLEDQAIRELCDASDLDPKNAEPYFFLGKIQNTEKLPPERLVQKLSRFVILNPEDARANYYYAVGLWKRRSGDSNSAELDRVQALLEKAVKLDPKFGAAYMQLGILYAERNNLPMAISEFEQAVRVSPDLEEGHYRLGGAYRQAGDTARSLAELEIYQKLSKQQAQEEERQHHEIQQFVYTLRDPSPQETPPASPH